MFVNLLGFLLKPELDTGAGKTHIKATHRLGYQHQEGKPGLIWDKKAFTFCLGPQRSAGYKRCYAQPASCFSRVHLGAYVALTATHRGDTVVWGAQGYKSTAGSSHSLPTDRCSGGHDLQVLAHLHRHY